MTSSLATLAGASADHPPQTRRFAGLSLERPLIMGIVNVTPDSFSDGGEAAAPETAIARGRRLVADGADIVDVGGESTRPGAEPVPVAEEMRRVLPVVDALAGDGCVVSVDTRRAEVMQAALSAGARIVNDVTALSSDPRALGVVAAARAAVVLMHMQGTPQTMQRAPRYTDVVTDIAAWLGERVGACVAAGIRPENIAIDPGIGFGKTVEHNIDIIRAIRVYVALRQPVCIGASRKSFIGAVTDGRPARERLGGSIAAALAALDGGAAILRVHDVAETAQAVALWRAVRPSR